MDRKPAEIGREPGEGMDREEFRSRNEDFYAARLAEHGATHRGVDFNSVEAMSLRFEQLMKIREGEESFSINDFGCAYGALYDWLKARGL